MIKGGEIAKSRVMLETAEERVKLLKKGLSGKEIEILYIEHNNFNLIRTTILYEANGFDIALPIIGNEDYCENSRMTGVFNPIIIIACGYETYPK